MIRPSKPITDQHPKIPPSFSPSVTIPSAPSSHLDSSTIEIPFPVPIPVINNKHQINSPFLFLNPSSVT